MLTTIIKKYKSSMIIKPIMLNLVLSCVYPICSWVIPVVPCFFSPDDPTDVLTWINRSRIPMAWVWVCLHVIILKYVEQCHFCWT